MKRMLICGAALLVMLATAAYAYSDVARPKTSPSPNQAGRTVLHTSFAIVPDSNSSEMRLQISESELKTLREVLASAQVGNPSMGQRIAQSSTRTIIAGLLLCLSVSFAGVWLARSTSRRSHKAIAAVALGIAVLGAAAIITHANAGPPGYVRWAGLSKALSEGRPTSGDLDIQIVPEGYGLKLIVPVRKSANANGEE